MTSLSTIDDLGKFSGQQQLKRDVDKTVLDARASGRMDKVFSRGNAWDQVDVVLFMR